MCHKGLGRISYRRVLLSALLRGTAQVGTGFVQCTGIDCKNFGLLKCVSIHIDLDVTTLREGTEETPGMHQATGQPKNNSIR
jgi:hypothetical protein